MPSRSSRVGLMASPPHLLGLAPQAACGPLDGPHDVLVPGAPADVAGDRPADLVLRGIGGLVQEGLGHQHHPGGAKPALQSVLFLKALLDRVQLAIPGEPLHGGDLPAVGLYRQEGAGFDGDTVQQHRASAAGRGVAPDVGAREVQDLSQEVHQEEPRFHRGRVGATIHHDGDAPLHGHPPQAGWAARACRRARVTKTRTTCRLYSALPRTSLEGSASCAAVRAASRMRASLKRCPRRSASARRALSEVGPTAVSPMPGEATRPSWKLRWTATPTVAKSPTFRSSLKYVPKTRGPGSGRCTSVTISSGCKIVVSGPTKNSDAGILRSPRRLRATMCPSSASTTAPQSPWGSAWHTLPTSVPRLRTSGSATRGAHAATVG